MKVSVVIPNYNGETLLEQNLPSVVKAMANPANKITEIIVVDDGSKDGSIPVLKTEFPEVKLIKHTKNRGFSATVNTGVRGSKGDIICLLNTDVKVTESFLPPALSHFDDEKVFAVSLGEEGYFWAKGFFEDGFVGIGPGVKSDSAHDTFWASGGSAVYQKSIWNRLGGMDEALFSPLYWEDIDISYRAAKRGYKILWEPKAQVLHEHESTVKTLSKNKVNRIRERNQLIFIWKNITSQSLTKRHVSAVIRRMRLHPGYARIVLAALRKIRHIKKARAKEKKEAKVSDETIFGRFK